jgi:tetratricopeptide (TPR) repeat protein
MILLERADSGVVANAQTDSAGKFEFRNLLPNAYILRIRLPGYATYERYLDLTRETRAYVIAELTPNPGKEAMLVPPRGAADEISARDAAIPPPAVKEFEKAKKLLVEEQNGEKSVPHLLKAIQLYERFPQAYVLLGAAYAYQSKWTESQQAFEKAIQIDDKMSDAYLGLGTLQNQQNKFADAEQSLAKAVELAPESFQAQYELGKSYWALKRNAEAEPHAAKAVALQPGSAEAHVLMGNVLLRKGDAAGALREFKESLKIDPNHRYAEPTRQIVSRLEHATSAQK